MGFGRFWLNMANKEIKVHVHSRVIRIFPMIQRAKNDRSVQRALPVYDNGSSSPLMHINVPGVKCMKTLYFNRKFNVNGA